MLPTMLLVGFVAAMLPKGYFLVAAAVIGWTSRICLTTDSNVDFLFVASVAALGLANLAVGALPA